MGEGRGRAKILAFQYYISFTKLWSGKVVGGGGGGGGGGKEGGAVSKVNALSRVPYRTARPPQQQKFVYTDNVANPWQPIFGQSRWKIQPLGKQKTN